MNVFNLEHPLNASSPIDNTESGTKSVSTELQFLNADADILVIPSGKGSTVGSYVIYQMIKNNTAPKAIICQNAEPIIAIGAIISKIPMVDNPEVDIVNSLENDICVTVDADNSLISIN